MEIKRKDDSVYILMKASPDNNDYDFCNIAYIEFTKEDLTRYLKLKDKFEELNKTLGVQYLPVDEGLYWIEEIPEELIDIYEELEDTEHLGVTQIPESFLNTHECRIEYTEAHIGKYGVSYRGQLKNTNVGVSTWSLSWEFIKECLKNCDPQSIRFIKDEKA